ncbi:hypothetical protein [uncultured Porphyromonas sp.]|mgnify:CR=1 FL=1|jgi:hypothetical protein|uniref:hypothetical protein n=1 Tax=uncultured Porphyromonas sp. TaxID=159274 RepID=UPI00263317BE|nr:hypothetical protein [uncultured Porphyromonas sp.]
MEEKKGMEKKVYWITSAYASQFDSLRVKEGVKILPEEREHMIHCLWFEDKKVADDLLKEIKETIRNFYSKKELDFPFEW